jgi:hypothetical protein
MTAQSKLDFQQVQRMSSLHRFQTRSEGVPASRPLDRKANTPVVYRPPPKANHLPISSAEIKNAWCLIKHQDDFKFSSQEVFYVRYISANGLVHSNALRCIRKMLVSNLGGDTGSTIGDRVFPQSPQTQKLNQNRSLRNPSKFIDHPIIIST